MDTSHQAAPAAAAMLKDMTLKMNGSVWTTEEGSAASEYMAFQKLAVKSELASVLAGGMSGISANGLDRVMRRFSGGEGMPYLTEINVTVEGTSPAVDMMKQMGPDEDHQQGHCRVHRSARGRSLHAAGRLQNREALTRTPEAST